VCPLVSEREMDTFLDLLVLARQVALLVGLAASCSGLHFVSVEIGHRTYIYIWHYSSFIGM
jgi:hypothetical protein